MLCLSPDGQAKLLRALDSGEIQPLGDDQSRVVDVRVVGAMQEHPRSALANGGVRRDLFQRLAGVVIFLPPLVERPEDIAPLARHFAERQGQTVDREAVRVLREYDWPGNVRELQQVVERAGRMVANGTLPASALAESIRLGNPGGPAVTLTDSSERSQLISACEAHGWHADRVATALGVHRATLFRRLKRAGISLRQFR